MNSPPLPVASSSTLWAKASKQWEIPPKPKPGRKPKKDADVTAGEVQCTDSLGRKVQNRAAQRAFRERKQVQLAELQTRLQSYEQGEIERNVTLQALGKRLKEENEALRQENTLLKEELSKLRAYVLTNQVCSPIGDGGKRARETSWTPETHPLAKRRRVGDSQSPVANLSFPHSSSIASSPSTAYPTTPATPPSSSNSSVTKTLNCDPQTSPLTEVASSPQYGPLEGESCGFCSSDTTCMCRELGGSQTTATPSVSILDNLPPVQPAVPLRRRNPSSIARNPVITLIRLKPASCSGDPENCPACKDDTFGKAFCSALGDAAAQCSAENPCPACPSRARTAVARAPLITPASIIETASSPASRSKGKQPEGQDRMAGITLQNLRCCGNPSICGDRACTTTATPREQTSSTTFMSSSSASPASSAPSETIPCDDAWRQLKQHPNIAFADLNLLADVVAGRSSCSGPRLTSPEPTEEDQRRSEEPDVTHSAQEQRGSLTLVPQEVLLQCGRKRISEVQVAGVREALNLLDGVGRR